MDSAKIRLSPEEEALVTRADWILTKNSILQKIKQLLATLQTEQKHLVASCSSFFPAEILNTSPKISKGENYKGLPYIILDYPRYFNKENIFAIRTLFWWGNFFSVTLHLSGIYKKKFEERLIRSFELLKTKDFSICINDDPWEHHFEPTNYLPLSTITAYQFEEAIRRSPFIKLSKKNPLGEWNKAEKKLLEIFSQLINSLAD